MSDIFGISNEDFDYLVGQAQNAQAAAVAAVGETENLAVTGATTQVTGFNASGQPEAKNVGGDANGAGLAFSGNTLTATLPQNLQTSGSPTFNALTLTTLLVGSGGTTIKKIVVGTVAIDPPSIAAQTRGSQTFTVTGAAAGDILILLPPAALNAGLVYAGCDITGASTGTVYLGNLTGGAIDDGSNTWIYCWVDVT